MHQPRGCWGGGGPVTQLVKWTFAGSTQRLFAGSTQALVTGSTQALNAIYIYIFHKIVYMFLRYFAYQCATSTTVSIKQRASTANIQGNSLTKLI